MAALQARPPKRGATIEVIGAGLFYITTCPSRKLTSRISGLPRTGSNSFCAALEILLNGPAYHAGVQSLLSGDINDVLPWITIAELRPYRSLEDRKQALSLISTRLDGYIATADTPLIQLTPELMELYPNAKVIVTTRDKDSWATSMELSVKLWRPRLLYYLFFWLGGSLKYLPKLWTTFTGIFEQTYGTSVSTKDDAYRVYDAHNAWIETIVPKERLLYFSVKDGWEPLCQALDAPVPDQPFPRLNDAKAFEDAFKGFAIKGLMRWAIFVGVVAVCLGIAITVWTKAA